MQLNSIIFPAPPASYSIDSEETIIWIPKKKTIINKISDFNITFSTPNHKKSFSFDLQSKLFSPKCILNMKKQPITNKNFMKSYKKNAESIPYFTPETFIKNANSTMSKKTLRHFILNKNKHRSNNNDDGSDKTNSINSYHLNQNTKDQVSNQEIISTPRIAKRTSFQSPQKQLFFDFGQFLSQKQKNITVHQEPSERLQEPSERLRCPSEAQIIPLSQNNKKLEKIPCFLIQYSKGSNLIFVHFHGNAEDIGDSFRYMKRLSQELKVNALLVEYPGYGIYKGTTNSEEILKDAEIVFDYLVGEFGINPKNIILIGRSIGTGAATHLASCRNAGGLILISGCTSVKAAVKDYAGRLAKFFISERFENIEKIKNVNCPILLIHGLLDKLIPYKQSVELRSKVKESVYCELFLSLSMTHNEFDIESDLCKPMLNFLKRGKIIVKNGKEDLLKIPKEVNVAPLIKFKKGKTFLSSFYTKIKITK